MNQGKIIQYFTKPQETQSVEYWESWNKKTKNWQFEGRFKNSNGGEYIEFSFEDYK